MLPYRPVPIAWVALASDQIILQDCQGILAQDFRHLLKAIGHRGCRTPHQRDAPLRLRMIEWS